MTPADAYDLLESLSPVAIKNGLLKALIWQIAHGKRLVHAGFYLRAAWYTEHPRDRQTPAAKETRAKLTALTARVGTAR
ncbi:MAG: hypothetical protein Q8R91_02705 [Candidatus Omnitrophota bacterium]|nr:hypothetical protein [Candidatus Omnitrophota bacterium]